jgi:hypothetical protein
MPLERVFGHPTPAYFSRNTSRFLSWLETSRPELFKGAELAFLRSCLGKVRVWTVEFDDGTELTSYGWRLPRFADSHDDRFHCLPGEPLHALPGTAKFLSAAKIKLAPAELERWVGVEWDRGRGSWSALLREPGAGMMRVSETARESESRVAQEIDEAALRALRFPDRRAVLELRRRSDAVMLVDLAVFNVFWAPDFTRDLINRVNEEFGFPVREVEWREGRWHGVVLP